MSHDEALTRTLRQLLKPQKDCVEKNVAEKNVAEKKLFGGTAFLLRGNVCCGAWKGSLILRLGEDMARHVLGEEHTRPFDPTGKPMRGWVMVEPAGWQDAAKLRRWVSWAVEFTSDLPPK